MNTDPTPVIDPGERDELEEIFHRPVDDAGAEPATDTPETWTRRLGNRTSLDPSGQRRPGPYSRSCHRPRRPRYILMSRGHPRVPICRGLPSVRTIQSRLCGPTSRGPHSDRRVRGSRSGRGLWTQSGRGLWIRNGHAIRGRHYTRSYLVILTCRITPSLLAIQSCPVFQSRPGTRRDPSTRGLHGGLYSRGSPVSLQIVYLQGVSYPRPPSSRV